MCIAQTHIARLVVYVLVSLFGTPVSRAKTVEPIKDM